METHIFAANGVLIGHDKWIQGYATSTIINERFDLNGCLLSRERQ